MSYYDLSSFSSVPVPDFVQVSAAASSTASCSVENFAAEDDYVKLQLDKVL